MAIYFSLVSPSRFSLTVKVPSGRAHCFEKKKCFFKKVNKKGEGKRADKNDGVNDAQG